MAQSMVHKLKLDDSFEAQKRTAQMISQGLIMREEIKPDKTKVLSPEVLKEAKERAIMFRKKYNMKKI